MPLGKFPSSKFLVSFFIAAGIVFSGCASRSRLVTDTSPHLLSKNILRVPIKNVSTEKPRASEWESEVLAELRKKQPLTQPGLQMKKSVRLPTTKLSPTPEEPNQEMEMLDENDEVSSEKIATSRFSQMHWYYEGMQAMAGSAWEIGVEAFRQFLKEAPWHVYADRAHFWVVRGHFNHHEYAQALWEANRFVSLYPMSFRLPEVYVLRAQAQVNLGHRNEGRALFREFLKEFPNHDLSDTVSRHLTELSLEER